jgi:hypothetical protein
LSLLFFSEVQITGHYLRSWIQQFNKAGFNKEQLFQQRAQIPFFVSYNVEVGFSHLLLMGPRTSGKINGGKASSDCKIIFSPASGSTVLYCFEWLLKIM